MASSRCIARWRCEDMTRRGSAIGIPANILGGKTVNKQEFHERLINAVECELSYVQQFEDMAVPPVIAAFVRTEALGLPRILAYNDV